MSFPTFNPADIVDVFSYIAPDPSTNDYDRVQVIPGKPGCKAIITNVEATGGDAGSKIHFYQAQQKGYTTVRNAEIVNSDDLNLIGDAAVNDTLNGIAVAANDFVLVSLDAHDPIRGGWQFLEITAVGNDVAGDVHISNLTPYDNEQACRTAIKAGAVAYVIWAEDQVSIPLGAASISKSGIFFTGQPGRPIVTKIETNGSTGGTYAVYSGVYVRIGG